MRPTRPALIALAAVLLYLGISFDHLGAFPRVGEDEPWIAAAPYKLATQGVYGSDLFAGYYGVERHNYQQMPLYEILEAAVFKVFGAGVAQMRALSVFFGLGLLAAVFAVGRLVADDRVAAAAVLLMLVVRIAPVHDATGIILLDRARVARYDIAVPVFGLIAFLLFERGALFLCGVLVGLATLSHLYGIFWLPAFAAVLCARRGGGFLFERPVWTVTAGFALAIAPWAAYVASGWSDFRGQMLFVAARFDVFSPSFYLSNVLTTDGPISLAWLRHTLADVPVRRVGTWTVVFGVPAAVGVMAWQIRRRVDTPLAALLVCAIVQFVLFVALLKIKIYAYTIAIWPLGALCLAWLGLWLWDRFRLAPARLALAALAALLAAQGSAAIVQAHAAAVRTTPYDFYEAQVAQCIPPGSRVLGLQHYWLDLRQFEYRTWLMPLNMAHPLYADHPVPLEQALDVVRPDVVLIDPYMRALFAEAASPAHPNHRYAEGWQAFVNDRHVRPGCVIRDPTYGTMEVYVVPRATPSSVPKNESAPRTTSRVAGESSSRSKA